MVGNNWLGARWLGASLLGAVLGVLFMLAPTFIACYVYSTVVFDWLWLIVLTGILIVPLEMERYAGEHTRSAFKLAGIFIWIALTAIFFAGLLPVYYYATRWIFAIFQPLVWAIEILIAFSVANWLVTDARASGRIARLRWTGRVGLLALVVVLAAGEYHTRANALDILKKQTIQMFTKLGIAVPPDSAFSAEYSEASGSLSSFEHPASSPSCTISTAGKGWKAETHYTGHRLRTIVIESSISKGMPITVDEARKILRQSPQSMSKKFNLNSRGSQLYFTRDGRMTLVLRAQ